MVATTRVVVTEAEFLALPETNQRVEFLDGEVIVAPSPTWRHQDLVGRLYIALSRWADSQTPRACVCLSPLDVRLQPGRIVQPDVFLFLNGPPDTTRSPIDVVPDLCIEVVSSDRVYDRVTKRAVYAEAGVREYWIVEQQGQVERLSGAGLVTRAELDEVITSELLPGFRLTVAELRGG